MTNIAYATAKIVHNSQPSYNQYESAVVEWREGEAHRFEFAVKAAEIVGNYDEGKTAELARRIRRSVSTVQNYAKVGKLWERILATYPSQAEILRDDLQTSHWLPVARLWDADAITLDGAYSWLKLCRKNEWTVEDFRAQLPTLEGRSEMAKDLKQLEFKIGSVMASIDDLMIAPAFDVDPAGYRKFRRALMLVQGRAANVMRK